MADIKGLRSSIRSVDSMLHLTTAMGLVASSKMYRASQAMENAHDFAQALRTMTTRLAANAECQNSAFLNPPSDGDKICLVVIAGDRGLCGGYNNNIFRLTAQYADAEIIPIGKRASERFGGELTLCESFTCDDGYALAQRLIDGYLGGTYGKVGIVCTKYVSMMTQEAAVEWLLPLTKSEETAPGGILFEPEPSEVLSSAVREYVFGALMEAIRESFACETAARRMAMDNAGRNAQQMLDDLRLEYNRARQGAITQEITEIVAGSGA